MTFLIKVACASGAAVGVGGAGLVGSNYAFPKSEMVDIKDNSEQEWEARLSLLANKINGNDDLKTKVAGTTKTDLDFKASPTNSKEFNDKTKALAALKAWCKKATTKEEEIKLNKELCKKSIKKGWLFNNAI